MTKLLKKVKAKAKLALNRVITNAGLFVFTHNRKLKDIQKKKNIQYGKFSLQKYDLIAPNTAKKLPVVFYFHGGAWSSGDKYGYTMFCSHLAQKGYIVCNIDYRLMPKVGIKTCIADCILAIRHFAKHSETLLKKYEFSATPNFENTFLVGDSAGAHISSLLAGLSAQKNKKLPIKISALGLYYGVYDFEHLDDDPSPIMQDLNNYWLIAEKNPKEIYKKISSTNYISTNYPPCFLTSGEIDKLHFQTEVFVKLLKSYNIQIDYLSFNKSRIDAEHAFLNAGFLPSAKEAFERLTNFFEKYKEW